MRADNVDRGMFSEANGRDDIASIDYLKPQRQRWCMKFRFKPVQVWLKKLTWRAFASQIQWHVEGRVCGVRIIYDHDPCCSPDRANVNLNLIFLLFTTTDLSPFLAFLVLVPILLPNLVFPPSAPQPTNSRNDDLIANHPGSLVQIQPRPNEFY